MMEQWNIDLLSIANDAEVSQVLRMPFITNGPAPFMPGHYRPILNPQVDTSPPAMFNHEAGLTSRLDQYVFLDLERALVQIAYWSSTIPQYRPAPGVPWVPLFSLPGTYARLYAKPNADEAQKQAERKLPDRCTLEDNSDPPPFGMKGPPTRCVGEIKPSYKFSGLWLLDYIPAVNANIPVQGMQAPWKLRQTSLVLAQVTYYMRRLGLTTTAGGLEGSCTYGYIITDKEVVLLKRLNARAGLGNTRALAASKPFPLRQVPQGAVSGE
ncbi:hypothetical protein C8Q73DRAFT_108819 [Cubamyces lactineus]|nr:hypothetical protein C8Q73DRAFT_108819 [Cubamyces lactineus]